MAHPLTSDPTRPAPQGQSILAPLPGARRVPPTPTRSDPPPPAADPYGMTAGAGSSSDEETPPTPTDRPFGKLTAARTAPYEAVARGAIRALGGLINSRMAAHEEDECFIPDHDDEKTIPPPVGRLMARRVPFDISADNLSDAEDLAAAAVGLIAWAVKGVTAAYQARRELRRALKGAAVHDDSGEQG